ncbi:MAG: TonB-dependent receptor [Hyphomonadaceae bacterium]|nr:TonB-dependent receptor [Hyphomonadaceae bacterium]
MSKKNGLRTGAAVGLALSVFGGALALTPGTAWAQATGAVGALTEEDIVVTATKRDDVLAQDVPGAITAFSSEQLEALNFDDLSSLSYTMPNVQLEDIGTAPGIANFGIRGLGINSSIPSVDPTVGVFVDGVYYGINAGIVVDNFDLEAVEVLRGPQGTLYGRNVTGGAVLIRTTAPSDVFRMQARAGYETGPEWTADFSISGPLAPGLLSAKLAVYHNDDSGWFTNDFDGSQFGASTLDIYRFALRATPTENVDMILRLEQGYGDSDGPAAQNHGFGQDERGSFDFTVNNRGYAIGDWEQAIFEVNVDVPFGDGTITNIAGWRDYEGYSSGDIDATGGNGFHSRAVNLQEQWSNELRYAGTFGPVDVTAGLYWFEQTLFYVEERSIAGGAIFRVGGGNGTFSTEAAFANFDWHLNEQLTLSLGARYTQEEKDAQVSRIRGSTNDLDGAVVVPGEFMVGGNIDTQTLNYSDSPFDLRWHDLSPRVGIQWEPNPDTNLYAYFAQGFRAGGVNFRTTTLGSALVSGAPQAFDPEEQDSFEIGWKQDFMDGRARMNFAVFHNIIDNMQRETNVPDPAGVQQVIVNAGEAEIQGAELEARFAVTDNFLLTMQVGYTHGEYNSVTADLDNSGTVDAGDLDQDIPRLAPWTYGFNAIYDLPIFGGVLSSRVGYNHRDASAYNDTNVGQLSDADIWDANFTYRPDQGNWSLAIYGDNLTDQATWGGDTILPDSPLFGGDGNPANAPPTFSPLNEGRVIGIELRLQY